jgi:hypothetical protein
MPNMLRGTDFSVWAFMVHLDQMVAFEHGWIYRAASGAPPAN